LRSSTRQIERAQYLKALALLLDPFHEMRVGRSHIGIG
jgi:hypothetical protein